jgi:GNAT superfamily N-acetyltransferase
MTRDERPGLASTRAVMLRLAVAADVPMLRELIARSARGLSAGFYTPVEIESAVRHVFGVDSTLIADGTYFVAELDGSVAGCGGWSFRRNLYGGDQRPVGSAERLDPEREPARIRAFFVAPEAARRGVGRALLAASIAAARRSGFKSLELMATLPGVPFYAALGFASGEAVTDTMPDGVPLHLVRMSRAI